ncbi:MAG: polysaccharide deacetylase family protein [Fidelibacterota bacterium]
MSIKHILVHFLLVNLVLAGNLVYSHGAIVRGDTTKQQVTLIFTGGDYADGGEHILSVLDRHEIKGAFFFTGKFYEEHEEIVGNLKESGHYLGAHSYDHLLYCSWENRDSTLVTKEQFLKDLEKNYEVMEKYGLSRKTSPIFLPPYEWYNEQIADWCRETGITLINMSRGTLSHADYTIPSMNRYWSSDTIYHSIIDYEKKSTSGLNGFLLLIHIGTHPDRTDKFYYKLDELIEELQGKGYEFIPLKTMLSETNPAH